MHRPSNCALAFSVPLSVTSAQRHLRDPSRDFVRAWYESRSGMAENIIWEEYERIVQYAYTVVEDAKNAGVCVCIDATLADWSALLNQYAVCTLFAHWRDPSPTSPGMVEFADGLANVDTLLRNMPSDFRGILDLAVCNSVATGSAIKARFPHSTVIMNRGDIKLGYRLVFYRQTLRVLAECDCDFPEAYTRVHLAALDLQ
jgi:hypothetical protein